MSIEVKNRAFALRESELRRNGRGSGRENRELNLRHSYPPIPSAAKPPEVLNVFPAANTDHTQRSGCLRLLLCEVGAGNLVDGTWLVQNRPLTGVMDTRADAFADARSFIRDFCGRFRGLENF